MVADNGDVVSGYIRQATFTVVVIHWLAVQAAARQRAVRYLYGFTV